MYITKGQWGKKMIVHRFGYNTLYIYIFNGLFKKKMGKNVKTEQNVYKI